MAESASTFDANTKAASTFDQILRLRLRSTQRHIPDLRNIDDKDRFMVFEWLEAKWVISWSLAKVCLKGTNYMRDEFYCGLAKKDGVSIYSCGGTIL
jgi:hypothetical protein